ncbi:MAG TPA: UDP-N-acetylmuramoyl-L-alanyl-D-glutamate--2,6-diaminopimelate ligase, partial [Vampirovibrionales bacterium]
KELQETNKIPFIYTKHGREALAEAANCFYEKPSNKVKLIGVTGTNGKTTTTHLIAQALSSVSLKKNKQKNFQKVGLIGTLGTKIYENGKCIQFLGEGSGRTTPEATELQELISSLHKKNCSYVVMEVSSHSLEQGRVHKCNFASAVFTNLTQDHLDYHLTMQNYYEAKKILFDKVLEGEGQVSVVINSDDQWGQQLLLSLEKAQTQKELQIFNYFIKQEPTSSKQSITDLKASNPQFIGDSSVCTITYNSENLEMQLPMNGLFNIYNALATLGVCLSEGASLPDTLKALKQVEGAPGRFQLVKSTNKSIKEKPTCIVDYAHTPDGLENVLKAAKNMLTPQARLLCLFGCGGDRDTTKRPIMGQIAENYADYTIVTSDNPRTEEPNQIIADIMAGFTSLDKCEVEIDRKKAIEKIIKIAKPNDVVLIAGKGHEDYQIFADRTEHFDDYEEVLKCLEK